MQLTKEQIKSYIPHREPMLLLDRIVDVDTQNKLIHAQFDVKADWDILEGHFPGNPIMPGVLITESCAQASAVLTNIIDNRTSKDALFYFVALDNVRFKKPVVPQSILDLKVKMVKRKSSILKFEATASIGDTICTVCEFTAKVIPQ